MSSSATPSAQPTALYGGTSGRRVTVRDIAAAKQRHEKWPMLTAYDALAARVFDDAGIPVLLVGDSAAMVVYGYDSTIPVTVDELIPLTAAVVRGSKRAMVVADLFLTPTLYFLQGCSTPPEQRSVRARMALNLPSQTGRVDYTPARLVMRDGQAWAEPIFGKSNQIFTLVFADGMIVTPRDSNGLGAGPSKLIPSFVKPLP